MEKEMKKLLLVAVSVGFFLLVTITVAIIVLTPKTKNDAVASPVSFPNGKAQKNWDEAPAPAKTEIAVSQEPKKTEAAETDKNDGGSLTIIIPAPSAETAAETVQTAEKPKAPEQPVTAVKAPEPATKPSAQTAVAAKPAAAAKPEAKPSAAAKSSAPAKPAPVKTINDFWIQTGAFSAQVRAEDARELLATKGITSIIENREINGRVWYRVRLGPYTSEREANHWLEIVKLIDGFNDSQIRQTPKTQ